MIDRILDMLVTYGLSAELIQPADVVFVRNALLGILQKEDYTSASISSQDSLPLQEILATLCDDACQRGLIEDTPAQRDLFDTALMGVLTPRPSAVNDKFMRLENKSPEFATSDFYRFCHDTNYIRRDRSARDLRWTTNTDYGDLDITINLSKPEKDPRDIAAAGSQKTSGYPACVLCAENEGYAGHTSHPARQNLRIIPVDILGEPWGFQYSPYVYYNEHAILLNTKHVPMVIDDSVFAKLFSFVSRFPHYFMGSNGDLPIVGGSILSHEHFQGGRHSFAMARAPIERHFEAGDHPGIEAGILKWPMSVIRLRHADPEQICRLACTILHAWRDYSDPKADILSHSQQMPHNTITPIARKSGNLFELDLVLRNNRTSKEHPCGIFHPHEELHHIKKENIGLIEVLGLAVLPGRLSRDITKIRDVILDDRPLDTMPELSIHSDWIKSWISNAKGLPARDLDDLIRREIGLVFLEVLKHAGVFKRTREGQDAFDRFICSLTTA